MKRIALILAIALMLFAFAACSDNETKKNDVDLTDPTLSITECIDVPYQFDLTPYIDITEEDYIGVEIEKLDATVTDEDVNNAIYAQLSENATLVDVTDRGAKMGDSINIDFTGYLDGVAFDNGAAENFDMVLGQAGFIPGFEDALVNHKTGEEFTIDVTFPEDYNEELAGKDAQFKIKMNSIKEQILPEFNEEFIKEVSDCDTVDAYLAQLKEQLIVEKAKSIDDQRKGAAFEAIYKSVEFKDYPKSEYDYYYNDFVSYYENVAKTQYGMDLEKYITDICSSTEEEFYYYADLNAQTVVEQELIFFAIANQQKLWQNLTKGDYDTYLATLAPLYDLEPAEFEQTYGASEVWKSLIYEKAISFVIEKSVEVEPTETTDTVAE